MNRLLTIRLDSSVSDYEYFSAADEAASASTSSSAVVLVSSMDMVVLGQGYPDDFHASAAHANPDDGSPERILHAHAHAYAHDQDNDNRSIYHGCYQAARETLADTDTVPEDVELISLTSLSSCSQQMRVFRWSLKLFFLEYYRMPILFLSMTLLVGTLMGIWLGRCYERARSRTRTRTRTSNSLSTTTTSPGTEQANSTRHRKSVTEHTNTNLKSPVSGSINSISTGFCRNNTSTSTTPFLPKSSATATKIIPKHIAIVMDGNRRYGRLHGCNGHAMGARQLGNVIEWVLELPEIKELTLFCFSTENWKRDAKEVDYLFQTLLKDYIDHHLQQTVLERCIKVRVHSTHWYLIPLNVQIQLRHLQESTAHFVTGKEQGGPQCNLILNLCISYGSRQEIVSACQRLIDRHVDAAVQVHRHLLQVRQQQLQNQPQAQQQQQPPQQPQQQRIQITEDDFARELCVQSDPDLLIRTAGDLRLSNFLLWQSSYTELCFMEETWPAVTKERFREIVLHEYPRRQRRFGT